MLRVIDKQGTKEALNELGTFDEIAREGARTMLMMALEMEVASYIERYHDTRAEDGHAASAVSPTLRHYTALTSAQWIAHRNTCSAVPAPAFRLCLSQTRVDWSQLSLPYAPALCA
jgi:hypothetical protein